MSWAILELAKLCDAVDHGLYVLHRLCSVSPPQCLTGSHAAYLEVRLDRLTVTHIDSPGLSSR